MGRQIGGSPALISVQGTVTTLTSQAGRQPQQPSITSPADNSTLSNFTPTITSSAFFVYNSDTHSGSNWQIATDSNFTIILKDLASVSSKTSWAVNGDYTIPRVAQTLYVRVRYVSSASEVSPWSNGSRIVIAQTLSAVATFNGATDYNFVITYGGTGSATSFNVLIANNPDMTSPVVNSSVSASSNVANLAVAYTTLPGFAEGTTTYYMRITPVGADAVTAPQTVTLANPVSTVTGVTSTTASYDLATLIETRTPSLTLTAGTAPGTRYQFATSSAFTTITYESNPSSALFFASSNLPGISTRTSSYYFRPVLAVGSDRIPISGFTPLFVSAVQKIIPGGFGPGVTYTGTYTIPASYSGPIQVIAIGGGGGGSGTAYDAGSGGAGGQLVTTNYTVAGGETVSYTLGAGGNNFYWAGTPNASNRGGTTTVTVGSLGSFTAVGGLAGFNNGMGTSSFGYGSFTDSNGNTAQYGGGNGATNPPTYGGCGGNNSGTVPNLYYGKYTAQPSSYYSFGGRNALDATSGGIGGYGYGAGGGGSKRDQAAGGGSNSSAGGGGNGIYFGGKLSGDGYFGNVGGGGDGVPGAIALVFTAW
jgi:hypothetical protein